MTGDDDADASEREADRLIEEAGPLRERYTVLMAAARMGLQIRRGETPEPVTAGDTTISYDPRLPESGIVIRDFLGREFRFEDWASADS